MHKKIPIKPSTYLSAARLFFFLCIVPCIVLDPQIFRQDLGLSNYGVNPRTAALYSLGFLSSIVLLLLSANQLTKSHTAIRRWLRLVAVLQLALLIIPVSPIRWIRYTHVGIGISLFLAEFLFATWLLARGPRSKISIVVLVIQSVAGIAAMLSLVHILSIEAPSQLVFQLAFFSVLIQVISRVE